MFCVGRFKTFPARKHRAKPLKRGGMEEAEDVEQNSYRGLTRIDADKAKPYHGSARISTDQHGLD